MPNHRTFFRVIMLVFSVLAKFTVRRWVLNKTFNGVYEDFSPESVFKITMNSYLSVI